MRRNKKKKTRSQCLRRCYVHKSNPERCAQLGKNVPRDLSLSKKKNLRGTEGQQNGTDGGLGARGFGACADWRGACVAMRQRTKTAGRCKAFPQPTPNETHTQREREREREREPKRGPSGKKGRGGRAAAALLAGQKVTQQGLTS